METQHAAWLRQNARDKKGGIAIPAIVRGEAYSQTLRFPVDQTGQSFTGSLRISPDAPVVAANLSVADEGWDGTIHSITYSLTSPQVAALVADGDADGLAELVFDFKRGGKRFLAGVVPISGEV